MEFLRLSAYDIALNKFNWTRGYTKYRVAWRWNKL